MAFAFTFTFTFTFAFTLALSFTFRDTFYASAFTLAFAWVVDLVLTPALCSLMPIAATLAHAGGLTSLDAVAE